MTDTLSKNSIRHEALLHRDRIDPREESAEDAAENFINSIKPQKNQIIALYWPKGREFDTMPLLHDLLKGGWVCALPVMQKDDLRLKFARWVEDAPLAPGPFDIMQPVVNDQTKWADPDIFVVPMLAFDLQGNRLGYGKGYYDATLQHYRAMKDIVAVGYGYSQQAVLFKLPVGPQDEKMDWIVTPQSVKKLN